MKELQIQTLQLQTNIPKVSLNKEIQNRIITLFNASLKQEIEAVFKHFFDDEDIVIKSIELELPPISLDFLEEEYISHVKDKLHAFLEDFILKNNSKKQRVSNRITTNESIFYFLKNGVFPWDYNNKVSFSKIWVKAIQSEVFIRFINKNVWYTNMVKRLVYHLDEAQVNTTIQKLTPEQGLLIITYHQTLFNQYNKEITITDSMLKLKEIVHVFTLNYLLRAKGSRFNKKQFILWHLTKLSSYYNISVINLLSVLKQALTNLNNNKASELIAILQEITIASQKNMDILTVEDVKRMLLNNNINSAEALAIKKWMYISQATIQKSWIDTLNESLLEKGLKILIPQQCSTVLVYQKQLWIRHQKNESASLEAFKKAVWTFTYVYIAQPFSSYFNLKNFIVYHTQKLALYYNLSATYFRKALTIHFKILTKKDKKFESLFTVLSSLHTTDTIISEEYLSVEQIEEKLLTNQLSDTQKNSIKNWLYRKDNFNALQKSWIDTLNESLLEKGLKILIPQQCSTVLVYQKQLWIRHQKNESASLEAFKKAVWTFTYVYIAQSFSSYFNLKNFIVYHTQKLALYYNLSATYFRKALTIHFKILTKKDKKFEFLFTVLSSLHKTDTIISEEYSSVEQIEEKLLTNTLSDIQKTSIKNWLYRKNNFNTLEEHWITTLNVPILNKLLKIITPQNTELLIDYVALLNAKFSEKPLQNTSKYTFQKDVYRMLFQFLLQEPSSYFDKKTLLKQHLKILAQKYQVSFTSLVNYLIATKIIESKLSVFIVLTSLKKEVEITMKNYNDTHTFNFEVLLEFLKTGKTDDLDSTHLEQYFLYVLKNKTYEWILYLSTQKTPFTINRFVLSQFKTNSKHQIQLFVHTFSAIQKIKYNIASLQDVYFVCFIFYLQHRITPFNFKKQDFIPKNFSKKQVNYMVNDVFFTEKIAYSWALLSLKVKKQVFLVDTSKNKKLEFLFSFLKSFKLQLECNEINDLNFEKYFWMSFFKAHKAVKTTDNFFANFLVFWKENLVHHSLDAKKFDAAIQNISQIIYKKSEEPIILDMPKKEMALDNVEKWFTSHAGLVLLYPFIPYLFDLLYYTSSTKKIEDTNKLRAVHLLAYIATGTTEHEEHNLTLEKILCGLPIHMPLPFVKLTSNEIEKADMLLSQLIKQWDTLKNTSKEGLRNTFLLREGALKKQDEELLLQVEVKGFDILLDSYPWNLSVVKFFWMDAPVYVNWR